MTEATETTVQSEVPQAAPRGKVALALAKAQGEFPPIAKLKVAKVQMKAGGSYTYNYADLADVLAHVRPVLAKHELAITQRVEPHQKGYCLTTELIHASGEFLGSEVLIGAWPDPKLFGAELTYYRRYSICALLGIASDDDVDGEGLERKEGGAKKKDPEAPERAGLHAEILSASLEDISSASTTEELTARYRKAYGLATAAGDKEAQEKLLAEFRKHPSYIKPEKKQEPVT